MGDMGHITGYRLFHLQPSCTVLAHIGCHDVGPFLPYDLAYHVVEGMYWQGYSDKESFFLANKNIDSRPACIGYVLTSSYFSPWCWG